jgi:hypothetical protein
MKFLLIILPLFILACQAKTDSFTSEKEFTEFLNDPDNGHIVSVETNDMIVEGRLTPPIEGDKEPQVSIQLRINRQDGGSVLDFGGASKSEVLEKEGYLSFELMGDVYLENNGQIIPCLFHHYERNYGLKPSVDMFFQFKAFQPTEDVIFVYRDQLFNQGLIRLKFDKDLFKVCHVQQ